ncbi:MAG: ATP-binding protein [Chloroflexota bacterium]
MVEMKNNQPSFKDLEVLAEASQLLTVIDLDQVLHKVIALASDRMGAQKTSLFLIEDQSVAWEHLITMRQLSADQSIKVVSQVLEEGFGGWVLRQKKGDIIVDTNVDDRWLVFPDDPIITRSAMCVPFILNGEVIATVTMIHEEPNHFRPYHLRLMEIIANQTSVAIRNADLFKHIHEQQRQLHAVLQSLRDVLLVLNRHREIVMLNEPALPLLDVDYQGEAMGKPLDEFTAIDKVFTPIIDRFKTGKDDTQRWSFEARSERQNKDYNVRLSLWFADDEILGYVVVMNDITRVKDLARFKDEMLRVASHDLRSPLALVAGYADMVLLDATDADPSLKFYIDTIKQQVEKMSNLVDDLLRVERIRESPLELHESTDMRALLKLVMVNSRPVADSKSIRIDTDIVLEDIPKLVADPVLIRQAMDNLISNAIKYTPESGSVKVSANYDERYFNFMVEDTGIGIPEDALPFVFEQFYRVQSHRNKAKGSGLGLSLVKNIIRRHNGDVWVESEEGSGSRFGFWLPIISQ